MSVVTSNNTKKCSHCKNIGHNIKYCDSYDIVIFHNDLMNKINIIDKKYINNSINERKKIMRLWLFEKSFENKKVLMAYSIKYCGSNTKTQNTHNQIEYIIKKIYGEDNNEEIIEPKSIFVEIMEQENKDDKNTFNLKNDYLPNVKNYINGGPPYCLGKNDFIELNEHLFGFR